MVRRYYPWELEPRGSDSYGSGRFGARRRHGGKVLKHKGVDLVIEPGSILLCPGDLKFVKFGYTYNDDLSFRYAELLDGKKLRHRFFYLELGDIPVADFKSRDFIPVGTPLGYAKDLRHRYPADERHEEAITPHIHYEVRDHLGKVYDPSRYLEPFPFPNIPVQGRLL